MTPDAGRGLLRERELPAERGPLPRDVRVFLREADRRIRRLRRERHIPGFIPCDPGQVYDALRTLAAGDAAPGRLFCEWGSGFGVVACLAAMLEFDAVGIEIEETLVEAAGLLAEDFDLPVQFVHGSFIPTQERASLDRGSAFTWLGTAEESAWQELGLVPADIAVTFAYPWPDEETLVESLFERHAEAGAFLLTYHADSCLRLRQRTAK